MAFRLREDIRTALPQLPANWYQTIYADPPWDETGGGKICRGAQNHYGLMKQKDLLALAPQVKRITAPAAHLYLWVTNTILEDGLELARAWNVPMDWDAIGLELEDAQVSDGMLFDKRDPPQTDSVITPEQALIYWITGLQTEQEYDLPSIRVKGMDDPNDWTEIDLHNDDPTNLTDGTWTEPIMVTDEE